MAGVLSGSMVVLCDALWLSLPQHHVEPIPAFASLCETLGTNGTAVAGYWLGRAICVHREYGS